MLSVVIMLYCYCVALLLFVSSYVLIVCTVPLPPGVNPIAVDKYIYLFSLRAFLLTVFVLRVLLSSYVYLFISFVFVVPYVYLLYYVCVADLTLDAGLLARSQYPEGPATGHLDTGFSWFPCVYKRMLR